MKTETIPDTSDALRPLTVTLSAVGPLQGLASPLIVVDDSGWIPTNAFVDGSRLPDLLDAARLRWGASPHAAAALAWKSYSYWLAMPAVLSWAVARRVPVVDPENVLVRLSAGSPLLTVGLRSPAMVVLPDDPLANTGLPGISVAADEEILLKTLRMSLMERHLDPLSERIREHVKIGRRTLLGSVASGIAYALIRGGAAEESITTVLESLDLSDLIELVPGAEPGIRRKTCCLAFTLPQPKICTGCCLRTC